VLAKNGGNHGKNGNVGAQQRDLHLHAKNGHMPCHFRNVRRWKFRSLVARVPHDPSSAAWNVTVLNGQAMDFADRAN